MSKTIRALLRGETTPGILEACLREDEHSRLRAMRGCPQTRIHHQEGDVATHSAMVVVEASALPWEGVERTTMLLSALLHDVGKPGTTRPKVHDGKEVEGHWSAAGHAEEGARIVNELFGEVSELHTLPLGVEVAVHSLVRNHMWPHLIEKVSEGAMLRAAHLADPRMLEDLWRADGEGRICRDAEDVRYRYQVAGLHLDEQRSRRPGSWGRLEDVPELAEVSPRARRESFRALVEGRIRPGAERSHLLAREQYRGRGGLVYTMGLPGAGKSTWSQRQEQEAVVLSATGRRRRDRSAARRTQITEARELLSQGRRVLVDATNLRRESRDLLLRAAEQNGSSVEAVWFRTPLRTALERQRTRPWEDAVPEEVIRRMCREARFPSPDEYDTLTVVEGDDQWEWDALSRWESR